MTVLTSKNFTQWVNKHKLSLVAFVSSTCPYCVKLEPELERAAKILIKSSIPLAKVDAIQEEDLGIKYDLKTLPTLILFRKGRNFPYTGGREYYGKNFKK